QSLQRPPFKTFDPFDLSRAHGSPDRTQTDGTERKPDATRRGKLTASVRLVFLTIALSQIGPTQRRPPGRPSSNRSPWRSRQMSSTCRSPPSEAECLAGPPSPRLPS